MDFNGFEDRDGFWCENELCGLLLGFMLELLPRSLPSSPLKHVNKTRPETQVKKRTDPVKGNVAISCMFFCMCLNLCYFFKNPDIQ